MIGSRLGASVVFAETNVPPRRGAWAEAGAAATAAAAAERARNRRRPRRAERGRIMGPPRLRDGVQAALVAMGGAGDREQLAPRHLRRRREGDVTPAAELVDDLVRLDAGGHDRPAHV